MSPSGHHQPDRTREDKNGDHTKNRPTPPGNRAMLTADNLARVSGTGTKRSRTHHDSTVAAYDSSLRDPASTPAHNDDKSSPSIPRISKGMSETKDVATAVNDLYETWRIDELEDRVKKLSMDNSKLKDLNEHKDWEIKELRRKLKDAEDNQKKKDSHAKEIETRYHQLKMETDKNTESNRSSDKDRFRDNDTSKLREELNAVSQKLAFTEASMVRREIEVDSVIDSIHKTYATNIGHLQDGYAATIMSIEKKNAAEIDSLEQAHATKIEFLKQESLSMRNSIHELYAANIGYLQEGFSADIKAREKETAAKIGSLKNENAEKINALKETDAKMKSLEREKTDQSNKIVRLEEELKRRHASALADANLRLLRQGFGSGS